MLRSTDDYRRRTRELAALYASAGDLSSMRDVDQVLAAIVRRGRELLATDVAYLMLIDDVRHDTFMRVTVGTQSPDFMSIRLAYGEGICGLVAETASPQWTTHFASDPRWTPSVERIINEEGITAILAVPLIVGTEVIGVLCASDRRPREFEHDEVALLASLADHAAIALVNARLFEEREHSLEVLRDANERAQNYNRRLEHAARMHERLTELVATGASLDELAQVVSDGLGGQVVILDNAAVPLTSVPDSCDLASIKKVALAGDSEADLGSSGGPVRLAAISTNTRCLGFLVHVGHLLEAPDVRALERAALVTAILLLDVRAHDEAIGRLLGEFLAALVPPAPSDEVRVRERAKSAGIRLADGPFVVLSAIESQRRVDGALETELVSVARSKHGLAGVVCGHSLVILPGKDPAASAKAASDALSIALGAPVTVGGTGPYLSLEEAAGDCMEAIHCAKVLVSLGRSGLGGTPEEIGRFTLLFADVPQERIEAFVTRTISAVREYDIARDTNLLRTMEVFFDCGGQTGRISDLLHIHVNTLYQRLDRLDQLLGESWRRGAESLEIHLALRLARLLEHAV